MSDPRALLAVADEPVVLEVEGTAQSVWGTLSGWAESGLTVRVVRGRKMLDLPGVFDEFAAALQFPWYFVENLDALDECLRDLDWLPRRSGYVLVVTEPELVLSKEQPGGLNRLVGLLAGAAGEWAQPVESGERWDRPAVPFHVVLVDESGEGSQRWAQAGAAVRAFA